MSNPDYRDMRQMMLSQIEETCQKCGDRFFAPDGSFQCRRDECPVHNVRVQAHAMSPTAFNTID